MRRPTLVSTVRLRTAGLLSTRQQNPLRRDTSDARCDRRPRARTSYPRSESASRSIGYPHPVAFLPVKNDLQQLAMAYMDVPPTAEPNGMTVVMFHGKAFGGYYFENVIEALTDSGYRVVAPDQIGWGKSPKPDIHYSFQLLAANTAALLDHLGVGESRSWVTRPAA